MILGSKAIQENILDGNIVIDPWDEERLNPNSVDLTLGPTMLAVGEGVLDPRAETAVEEIEPVSGRFFLRPGVIYLGSTAEYTKTFGLVPCLEGKSSFARLGVSIHTSAGFGDVGFCGRWTLEILVVQPTFLYVGDPICQIYYHNVVGQGKLYNGHYQDQIGPKKSRVF